MTDLDRLGELWRERFPERAKGGEMALLGFRFQIIVALREAVRAFLIAPLTEASVFMEKVSDICQATRDDEVIVTQVKRIGRSVSTALEELWCIHGLVSDELPTLAPKLHYRLLCSQWTIKDVKGAIDRWQPPESDDSSQIACFKSRVTWTDDPNPLDELLSLVANDLDADQPLPTVLSWIGLLSDPENGTGQVWSDLHELRNKQQRVGRLRLHLWSWEDRSPETVQRGQFLTNEQPRLDHLQLGYFAHRPFYRTLAEGAMEWISSNPQENDRALRVPILWFEGRSGCGKSVALLHILAQLHGEGLGPIIWLGNKVELLPEAIRRAPWIAGPSDQVIIAVDDPYAPRTQGDAEPWREALAELDQLQNQAQLRPPLLICCGPTEQARQMEDDFSNEVRVQTLNVPHSLDDRPELESWFELRTGTPPPDIGSGDVVTVQLFFEWRTGQPLRSFAISLRNRLEEMDPSGRIRDIVYRIVAVNRLYTGYPPTALNLALLPGQRDAFADLLRQHHFAIDEDPERPGLWLAHPHLANALFEAWLPSATASHQRLDVLKTAILDQLRSGNTPQDQTATLWTLAKLQRMDEPFRSRLEADNPELLLQDVYSTWCSEHGEPISYSHLPVWITLRFAVPNLHLAPDPADEALNRLLAENKDETGFRLTCDVLLAHLTQLAPSQQEELTQRIVRLLGDTQDWREWPSIAMDAVWRIDNQELRGFIEDWLASDHPQSSSMLAWLVLRRDLGLTRQRVFTIIVRWLREHIDDPNAGSVLSAMLKRLDLGQIRASVATLALDWVQHCWGQPQVERVLRRLLGQPASPAVTARTVRLILDHLEQVDLQQSASFLLSAILRSRIIVMAGLQRAGSRTLAEWAISLGQNWLRSYRDDPGAPYVADRLLRLSEVSDAEWSKIASLSLAQLRPDPWPRDADYTLLSVARRRHLLSAADNKIFSNLIRAWLETARENADKALSRRNFFLAGKILAPTLPLAAHLGAVPLQEEREQKAQELRRDADEDSRDEFDRSILRLFRSHAWPSRSEGQDSIDRVGLPPRDSLMRKLQELTAAGAGETDPSLAMTLDAALNATETSLNAENFKRSGFLLSKMLPLSARLGGSYMPAVEDLTRRFWSSPLEVEERCGFAMECDRLIEANAWSSSEDAMRALEGTGIPTPMVLNHLTQVEGPLDPEGVSRAVDFADELMRALPIRAGLFLPAVLLLTEKLGDSALSAKCQQLVHTFMESSFISEGIKAGFARRLKELVNATISDGFQTTVEALGLQAPWLREQAQTGATVNAEELMRHLRQAEQFLEQGVPGQAGMLLAPLLVLAAQSGQPKLLQRTRDATTRMLEHRNLAPEERDGFTSACKSFTWPDFFVQDEVFEVLGIGALRLSQLLDDASLVPPIEVLQRSFDHAAEHLQSDRPLGAYYILFSGLPLASRTDDQQLLERALTLARQLLVHPGASARLRDSFSDGCIRLFREGQWRNLEVGLSSLAMIGINPPEVEESIEGIPEEDRSAEDWTQIGIRFAGSYLNAQAVHAFRKADESEKIADPMTQSLFGICLAESKEQEGISWCEKAIKDSQSLEPSKQAVLYIRLGSATRKLVGPSESIPILQIAVQLDPNNPSTHYTLGRSYEDDGQFSQALLSFKNAVETPGGHTRAQRKISELTEKFPNLKRGLEAPNV